jgi:hypothetical protein
LDEPSYIYELIKIVYFYAGFTWLMFEGHQSPFRTFR